MKLKTRFSKVLILVLSFLLGMGSTLTFATKDESAELALSYFRYANGAYKNGYALNTTGNEGESHKPIFQIMSSTNKTNYYCLNATAGESWVNGTIGTNATYNRTYDLNLTSDINLLKNDTNSVYKNVAGSHLNQILWILDNLYVPSGDAEKDLAQKRALLTKAGIVYGLTGETDLNGNPVENYTYKYQAQTGYDYKDKLKTLGYSETTTKQGWFYYEKNTDAFKMVELTDEMIEVAGQAALWYYTNYLENNSSSSQTYNVKSQGLLLASSNGTTETNSGNWKSLRNAIFNKETNVEGYSATVGMWQEEQATILCWYLIDAADKYADSNTSVIGNPLKITPATTGIKEKQVSSEEFQVVGPIKIDEQRTAVYTLSNDITIAVDGSIKTNTGAYISDANGNKKSNQNVSNYVGQEFYVAIPSSKIDGNEVKISFNGTYTTNEKKLWVNTTKTEQPVVEVTPTNKPLKLEVTAKIEDVKEFDLALRKRITKLTDSKGTTKSIINESSKDATRSLAYVATDIATNKTATYNHRKDPVVVKKGDIITYGVTIYNEGDKAGYATTIVDKLPQGLALKGYTASNTTTGTYTKGDVKYTYVYNPSTNEITFTNVNKNDLTAYTGGTTLASETIEIECEVVKEPSTTANTYLTNIAYISKEHNSVDNKDITNQDGEDRDSKPLTYPTSTQETTGTTYNGYKGNTNNQSVYNDTNNGYYYKGQEDDDDFEVVVIKKVEFDLALRKFISKISTDGNFENSQTTISYNRAPQVDTSKLKAKTAKTATYNHTKEPIYLDAGDYVLYTIRAYNEGEAAGYASQITDYLPEYLDFVTEASANEINQYWTYNSSTREVTTKANAQNATTLLAAFDSENDNEKGSGLSYVDVQIVCKVNNNVPENKKLTNIAEITQYKDKDGNALETDRDSQPKNITEPQNRETYNDDKIERGDKYIPGQQDDDDFEKVIVRATGKYDVILVKEDENGEDLESKAIFDVNGESKEVTGRLTIAKDVEINNSNVKTADVYTIKETKAPDKYCEFDGTITITVNKKLADDGKTYVIDKMVYKVIDSKGNDITDTKDATVYLKDGNLYVEVIDYEKEFDLKLMKFISEVNGKKTDRNITVDASNLGKIVNDKKVTTASYNVSKEPIGVKTGDYVTYTFRIYNEGELDGYAKEITEDIPEGLKFVTEADSNLTEKDKAAIEFNKGFSWNVATKSADGSAKTISTDYLSKAKSKDNLLKAFDGETMTEPDHKDVSVMFKVVSKDTSKIIRNEAEISDDEDEDGNPVNDRDSKPEEWKKEDSDEYYDNDKDYPKYKEDDEDYDNIIIKKVDLALTKFIVAISDDMNFEDGEYLTKDTTSKNAGSKENPYTRQTAVDTTPLKNGTASDAIYTRVKTPITVPEESYVLYNIRVYNEGEVDVYAGEVADYLPNYLDFISCEFNDNFGWKVGTDGKTVKTSYLSHTNGTDKMLKAFDKENDDGAGSKLDYKDLQILTRVNSKAPDATKLVNTAEITKYEDENGGEIEEDIDSKPENVPEKNKEQRVEDDDDWEVVEVVKKKVDLALSKFIAAISDDTEIVDGEYLTQNGKVGSKENPYTRATAVDTKELRDNPECHDATYTKVKEPLVVPAKSYVLYDIRVYNEGETDVYAGEVTDHLPEYLDFVSCEFNDNFGWKVESDGKTIKTTYLSYEKGEKNLLKAFDKKTDDGAGSGLDYRDLQVLCKVSDNAPSNTNIVNVAEITKYEDKNGNDIPEDVDSTPDNVDKKNEDDDDYEVVLIKTFDLSLLKWVSTVYVTEDGKTKTIQTGNTGDDNTDIIPKVEINRKKVNSSIVKFGYTIKITNEGDIEGYAKEITDYVPEGLKFYKEDNNGWEDKGNGTITTRLLENTLLKPGDTAEVTVIFRWINGSNNLGLKTNIAEISEDYNKEGVPDKDSTPGNKVWGEDDIDDAKVLLSISTGLVENIIMYVIGATIILVVLAGGILGIKKFVL